MLLTTYALPNFADPNVWISMLTLTLLEIVLGIDNIIFVSIIANRLPERHEQNQARNIGLILSLGFRLLLLFGISFIINSTQPLFSIPWIDHPVDISGKDLILILGGAFLLGKSTTEIFHKVEGHAGEHIAEKKQSKILNAIIQIGLVGVVFSFDSILTAVGLVESVVVMIIAVVLSMLVMLAFAGPIGRFIDKHPSLQMLALSFLIMIGVLLIAEGFHQHFDKGYVYFSMVFALVVELLNMRLRRKRMAVQLHGAGETAKQEGVM